MSSNNRPDGHQHSTVSFIIGFKKKVEYFRLFEWPPLAAEWKILVLFWSPIPLLVSFVTSKWTFSLESFSLKKKKKKQFLFDGERRVV
jgi:hypothetical protein